MAIISFSAVNVGARQPTAFSLHFNVSFELLASNLQAPDSLEKFYRPCLLQTGDEEPQEDTCWSLLNASAI
ncbi:hypothetical protein T03_5838 [Trichinella britovi]|uniref:Uncharacterized protein n=1 Tax=Trichinella britovi TaxID=45882 RepID=A0A0V1CZ45_TRIBR|nr:hypothetical protein T06_5491 [Trichinella sp. T6]KRY54503.1 hypothetical protein T03_5838 [Trichinella britovi]